jgi:hypothetical protein
VTINRSQNSRERERVRDIGVVYLAWHALGCETFTRFVESYRQQPAGCEHDLIVVYAGFGDRQALNDAHFVFSDIPHIGIEFKDVKLDIEYYLESTRRLPHEYLCFINTYTELKTPNWLAHLHTHAARDHVGIVGATGSYESLYSTVGLYYKINWLRHESGNRVSGATAHYYDFLIKSSGVTPCIEPEIQLPRSPVKKWMAQTSYLIRQQERDLGFESYWATLTRPNNALADYSRFPAFPNPHIRSNGFMVRRVWLASFDPSKIKTKMDACAFESGHESLTTQVRRKGLAAIVVARDGEGYDVSDWCHSSTFRLGDQRNLILTDNRSREFAEMSAGARFVHTRVSWGDFLEPAPADFPDFGFHFAKTSLSATRLEAGVHLPLFTSDRVGIGDTFAFRVMSLGALTLGVHGRLLVHKARRAVRPLVRVVERPFKRPHAPR